MRLFLESQLSHALAWGPAALYGVYLLLGEGAISAIYIYGGDQILRWIGLKS